MSIAEVDVAEGGEGGLPVHIVCVDRSLQFVVVGDRGERREEDNESKLFDVGMERMWRKGCSPLLGDGDGRWKPSCRILGWLIVAVG
jgi:hypothetical protein